jgi:cytochrome c oxidase cbb3-type subunit 3
MAQYQEHPMDGHESDGIKEFDNSLPKWWLYGFYFTIAFGVAYMVHYHVLNPGDVMRQEYAQEIAEAKVKYKLAEKKPESSGALVAFTDPENIEAGKKLYLGDQLCHTCHRADGGGLVGPDLTNDYWIHGSSIDSIVASIKKGYPEKGMLPYGNNTPISDKQVLQIASFVMSLRGTNPPDPKPVDPAIEKEEKPTTAQQ